MREQFLKQTWLPYPAMPTPALAAGEALKSGRVAEIRGSTVILQTGAELNCRYADGAPLAALVVGDIVCAHVSVQGEARELWLLAPCKRTPIAARARDLHEKWSHFCLQVRLFFIEREFLEAGTPGLVVCPGTEPYIDVFQTDLNLGKQSRRLFLPTSPELHLKKALAMDLGPVFEIKTCFRNGEVTAHHQPEFQMLEWYRPFADLAPILEDLEDLIVDLRGDDEKTLQITTMRGVFSDILGIEITPQWTLAQYQALATDLGVHTHVSDSITDVFHRIFMEKIETVLPAEDLIVIRDFPPFMSAYARLTVDGWADRFELYWQGLEIANAFNEVNDPELQLQRMQSDLELKRSLGKTVIPLDEDFIAALRSGMPPSGGIALGMERLFMAIYGVREIQELKLFPYSV